ncbi:lipopolysaccharide biosynthesis protein [Micromonospora radicis]|uniref:Polysaccharide biosynthesis protein n=1 Tax=Micromonospora radicis TaxID=1894971 RepID=A0A418MNJ6_9ACTN|nr:polysaccharide biosynthesis protein [Micromonospora radicis]RIV32593.1 polysaccharide biosynthesis protein [Micromonospora radicis]
MTASTTHDQRGLGAAGAAVAVAAMVTNGLAYLVPMLGARRLPAADLSVLATVLALVAIAGVAGMGLQMAVAVHRARHPDATTARVGAATTAATTGLLVVAAPLMVLGLHLPVGVVALLVVMTVPVVLAGRWLGELQGGQRFVRLAWAMGLLALGRYAGMVVALVLGVGLVDTLLVGTVTGYATLPLLAWLARRQPPSAATQPTTTGDDLRVRQVMSAGTAALAMLVVSYADLIFARQLLSPADSGAYAVGTVLTKGALWAPQVVTVLALPRLAVGDQQIRRAALIVVTACGAVLVAVSALAGGLAFRLAGGEDYAHLGEYAPYFAATGGLYALVFVIVNAKVATAARWPSAPLWVAAGGLAVLTVLIAPGTFQGIMFSALGTATLTTLGTVVGPALVNRGAGGSRRKDPTDQGIVGSPAAPAQARSHSSAPSRLRRVTRSTR